MQPEIFTICKYAEIKNGQMVINEPFHFISSNNEYNILDKGYIAIRIRIDANEQSNREFLVKMIDPDGIEVNDAIIMSPYESIQNEIGFRFFHSVIPITGMLLPKKGRYSFNLLNAGMMIQSIPFVVLN